MMIATTPTPIMARPRRTARVTWGAVVALEPRLGALLREIRAVRRVGERFCANARWYGYGGIEHGFKDRMSRLVGWERRCGPPLLTTQRAYDVAYDTLYRALPDCRRCGCF